MESLKSPYVIAGLLVVVLALSWVIYRTMKPSAQPAKAVENMEPSSATAPAPSPEEQPQEQEQSPHEE